MLNELHIENIAVIEKADISFTGGFNVLTGETGAGKSIVIDSIGAVLGDRVSRELVRKGEEKALVTAVFDVAGSEQWLRDNDIELSDELIIQRRISIDGKSGCRVCGTPVTVAQLKELASTLVDIHGQNDGRQLTDERRHLDYLDRFGNLGENVAAYKIQYNKYCAINKEIEKLTMDDIEKARLSDSLKYQIGELERAEIKPGECETLSARRDLLHNSEKLTEAISEACAALSGGDDNAVAYAQNASFYAGKAAALTTELEPVAEIINEATFNLSDAAETLRDFLDSLDFSPEEYDNIESRLSLLNKLQRKYSMDEDGLLAHLQQCRAKLDDIEYADDRLVKLKKELTAQTEKCRDEAKCLGENRRAAGEELQRRIVTELRELNMPSVRFAVEFVAIDSEPGFDSTGADAVRFVMSANAGEDLGRISRIASGGELSRIMLAMKNVFAENDPVGTMIFDEIDTGVSGIAAQRVGEKLYSVSLGKQVMCVTHLPQIAAMADSHFCISKAEHDGRTYTDVKRLDRDGRCRELARLHGGDNITQTTIASAEEQLIAAENYKMTRKSIS